MKLEGVINYEHLDSLDKEIEKQKHEIDSCELQLIKDKEGLKQLKMNNQ